MSADVFRYRILEALYDAPLAPPRWEDFLRLTAQAANGHAAALLLHFAEGKSQIPAQWNLDPGKMSHYEQHYHRVDVWAKAAARAFDGVAPSERFVPFSELKRSEFYNDFLLTQDISHAVFVMIEQAPSSLANLSIFRSESGGEFEEQHSDLGRFLVPHISRAYQLCALVGSVRAKNSALLAALDEIAAAVILVGSRMKVVTMNRAAELLTKANNGLQVSGKGLRAERAGETAQLHKLIAAAAATSRGTGLEAAGTMSISRRDLLPLQVLVSPVRGLDFGQTDQVQAIVFIHDPLRQIRPREDSLRAMFGLTRAECRVAILLADGKTPSEIGDVLRVSRNTLKSQLASIYRKTGTSRQSQLVRLLLLLALPHAATTVPPLAGA